jgi:CHAD domain-containing protein
MMSPVDEREVKLSVPPAFAMPDLTRAADGLRVKQLTPERTMTTYFDSDDLRLARAGASLRFRTEEGWTVKLPGSSVRGVLRRPELTFSGTLDAIPSAAICLVIGIIRTARLKRVARLRTVRTRTIVTNEQDERLAEVDHDEVSILERGNKIAERFRELEIELTPAMSEEILSAIERLLRESGAGEPDATSKYVRAVGSQALQPPDVVIEPLPPDPTAGDVVRAAITDSVAQLLAFDPVVRLDEDPEGVHQMRVATRRLRSHLRTFAVFTDPAWNAALREDLGWLGQILGANRDADVLLDRLRALTSRTGYATSTDRLVAALSAERDRAHAAVLDALNSDGYAQLLDRLVDAARAPDLSPEAGSPAHGLAVPVQAQFAALRRRVKGTGRPPADEELHRIRIHAKRTRYAAEALIPVVGKDARRFAASAAELQDVLGEHQDAIVMRAWLRTQATGRGMGTAAAFSAGELAGIERKRIGVARDRWRSRWKRLAAAKEPIRWFGRAGFAADR